MKYLQKIGDFIRNQKDQSEILNKKKYNQNYGLREGQLMFFYNGTSIEETTYDSKRKFVWPEFPLYSIGELNKFNIKCIDPEIFLKDICEITEDAGLEIIDINFNYDDWKNVFAVTKFRESDWSKGDGLPHDILDEYVDRIRGGMKKRKVEYLKNYNILSSQKTSQKLKFRTSFLYRSELARSFDFNGTFDIDICVNI